MMEGKRLNSDENRAQPIESNIGTGSPDITRMMTPTLSEEKSEDISLDFSKFETDTMLHSSYHPDRDIDRSPDPTCLQLQSPLDLSITTSFENSLSDCGVASCFDSESTVKSSYSFSNNASSTESDTFVHNLDEALPIDTLSKTQVDSITQKPVSSVNSQPAHPVILGSLGAANFVTAVLNKSRNMNQTPVLNNMIIPSTIAMSTPSIFVLNPCGLMNLVPNTSQPETLNSASSVLSICPPPIKSILSLLNSKPEEIPREQVNLTSITSLQPQIISLTPQVSTQVVSAQAVEESNQPVVVVSADTNFSEQLSPVNLCTASASSNSRSNIVDISDIQDGDDQMEDDLDLTENEADEVDGADSEMNDDGVGNVQKNDDLQKDIQVEPIKTESGEKLMDSVKQTDQIAGTPDIDPSINIVKKKRKQYGNRQKKAKIIDNLPFKCDLCSATFTISGNFLRHRKIHTICTEAEDPRFTCPECGRKFLQKCDLKRHTLIHTNQEPFRCTECDKGYIRKSDLKVHMRFHTKERSHPCDKCDKKFFQSGDLNRHKRQVHHEASSLKCGHCRKTYATEATLIRHMQSNHRELILKSLNERLTESSSNDPPGIVISRVETVSTEKHGFS